jgi:hypothetical protein
MKMSLRDLALSTGAIAAGIWELAGLDLVQAEFWSSGVLDPDVAIEFAAATKRVSLDRVELGIVAAMRSGGPFVSIAANLDPKRGSGLWLRRFRADCSLAVPFRQTVASVAVCQPSDPSAIVLRIERYLAQRSRT